MRAPFRHTFSASGISSEFAGGSLSLDWQHIRRASETRHHIGIWGERGVPMVLPKSQVSSADLEALREILRSHLQNNAKLNA